MNFGRVVRQVAHVQECFLGYHVAVTANFFILLSVFCQALVTLFRTDVGSGATVQLVKAPFTY